MNTPHLPAATRVLSTRAKRDTWLARRRNYLCSSDISGALGIHEHDTPHTSAEAVYYSKVDAVDLDGEGSEAAFWARHFGDTIAEVWAERNNTTLQAVGLVANTQRLIDGKPWQAATVRRYIERCPDGKGPCALLVLSRTVFVAGKWRDDMPDAVLARALWVALTCGFSHVHVVVLFGGTQLREATVRVGRHRKMTQRLLAGGERFWREHVLARVAPTVVGEAKARIALYEKLYADRRGVVELDGDQRMADGLIPALVGQRLISSDTKTGVERTYDGAKAALLSVLGRAEVATLGGDPVFWVDEESKLHVDMEELKKHPRVYRRCVTSRPSQVLRVTRRRDVLDRLGVRP